MASAVVPCNSDSSPSCHTTSTSGHSLDYVDLKVTNEQLNLLEWSFRRTEIPDSLARRGITLDEWKTVFDQCDKLWRKRSRELHAINEERDRYWLRAPASHSVVTAVWPILFLGLIMWGMFTVVFISVWFLAVVIPLMMALNDNTVFWPNYLETMANFEKEWSQLADEQRSVFQSNADVDVEQLQEIVMVHGRKPIWTVGLRFRFETTSGVNCRGGTAGDDDDVRDLERLLELNQNGGAGGVPHEEEYQRLKSSLIRKLTHSTAPPVATAMAVVVADDDDNNRHEGFYEKTGLLEMV